MKEEVIYDRKWHKLLQRSRWFQFLPFVDFVLAAGSLALGGVHQDSDFDVIVGCRSDRLYTARFFCLGVYQLLGYRPKRAQRRDAFCFNHFVTEASYCFQPPYNHYWQALYENLTPVCGETAKIEKFFSVNRSWGNGGEGENSLRLADLRFRYPAGSRLKLILEYFLDGRFGSWLEGRLKNFQIRKIKASFKIFPPGYRPRLRYDDQEVELHLDTRRTETYPQTAWLSSPKNGSITV